MTLLLWEKKERPITESWKTLIFSLDKEEQEKDASKIRRKPIKWDVTEVKGVRQRSFQKKVGNYGKCCLGARVKTELWPWDVAIEHNDDAEKVFHGLCG